jgi:hydroxypyruvate isomerase
MAMHSKKNKRNNNRLDRPTAGEGSILPSDPQIGWDHVFRRIDELGYGGWVGCEYNPVGDTAAGLAWRRRYGV